ncbi:MAG: hypothetical protein HRT68_01845 [Flavobacteriaceae bacterium]|nr:hypothetical protein [Flavobacteriaceae bacterium]
MKTKLLILLLAFSSVSLAQIYVNSNAAGANNGSSWADAYTSLQSALASASSGNEIWIAAGTYTPHATDRSTYFDISVSNLKIYGGFAGTEVTIGDRVFGMNETILSGDLQGNDINLPDFSSNYSNTTRNADNSYHVINILSSGENLLLDRLTISDAHTNLNTTQTGGAILKHRSVYDLTLRYCTIKDNVSRNTNAGLYADFDLANIATSIRGSLTIENCRFSNNMSRAGSGIYSLIRGNTNVDVIITNSLFDKNLVDDLGSNQGSSGSGSWLRLAGNGSNITFKLVNNTYVNNIDKGTQVSGDNFRAPLVISENGSISSAANAEVSNCIFWSNTGVSGGTRAISDSFEFPIPILNIYNSLDPLNFVEGSITSHVNTITSDPLFVDIFNEDYTLAATSPAVDSGDNNKVLIATDLLNNARVYNAFVDRGCYETGSNSQQQNNIRYVDKDATGLNNGTSWADAYVDLQDALQNVIFGDQIWIAEGVYTPDASDRTVYFDIDKQSLKLYGGFAGTETTIHERILGANETILSGDLQGNDVNQPDFNSNYSNTTRNTDNSYRVVYITADGDGALLDGLTISDAHANINTTSIGGAIIKEKTVSRLTLRNCIVKDNVSRNTNAGLLAEFDLNNTTTDRGFLKIENCQFTRNMSRGGSSIYSFVRANTEVDIEITNSLFTYNRVEDLGANTATAASATWLRLSGNGSDATFKLTNNTYANNIDSGTSLSGNNFRAPLSISENGSITSTAIAEVSNCIFWGNTGASGGTTRAISDMFENPIPTLHVYNSLDPFKFVEGSITSHVNTITSDPLFTDAVNEDFTLQAASPAIDSGDNTQVPNNVTTDLLGNLRITNNTVDRGCYEYTLANLSIGPKAFLQGAAINPIIGQESYMRDDLRSGGILPTTSPYSDALTCVATVFNSGGTSGTGPINDDIIDWMWLELRDANDNSIVVESRSVLLQRDGDIVDVDGTSAVTLTSSSGAYYLALQHRNHLGIMSANTIVLSSNTTTADLSNSSAAILGGSNAVIDLGNGIFAMICGDFDENGQTQTADANAITQLLGSSGYDNADLDMNGQIQTPDLNTILYPNIGKGQQF